MFTIQLNDNNEISIFIDPLNSIYCSEKIPDSQKEFILDQLNEPENIKIVNNNLDIIINFVNEIYNNAITRHNNEINQNKFFDYEFTLLKEIICSAK